MQIFNGNQGNDFNSILPLILIQDQEDDTLLTLIIAMQAGGLNNQQGLLRRNYFLIKLAHFDINIKNDFQDSITISTCSCPSF